jgi:uncharacterized lipoprotein YehR (DUF1307 family)
MKYLSLVGGIILSILMVAACQPQESSQPVENPSNGMAISGEYEGNEFTIATGNEDEVFMDMAEAFNRMDAEALWQNSADTVMMRNIEGVEIPLTESDMAGFFSSADSLSWDIDAVIPVKTTGSDVVRILVDSREVVYMKDGNVMKKHLFEEFTFKNGKMVKVRQWDAAMADGGAGSM